MVEREKIEGVMEGGGENGGGVMMMGKGRLVRGWMLLKGKRDV